MRKQKNIAIARFWYEGNAFSPIKCTLEDFKRREWNRGSIALEQAKNTTTELGGVALFAQTHPHWNVTVLRCASALPAGPIEDDTFLQIKNDILDGLKNKQWDAIYLSLHGAAITTKRLYPDIELLEAVRQVAPNTPIGVSFDLHANIGPKHAELIDVAAVYRTYPHIDMHETALRVLHGLDDWVYENKKTKLTVFRPNIILSSFNMRTESGPMQKLLVQATQLTQCPIKDLLLFGGFPYADTPLIGSSILALSDKENPTSHTAVEEAFTILNQTLIHLKSEFDVTLPTPDQAIEQGITLASSTSGLIAITDPADNPLSGGTNDTPALLAAALNSKTPLPRTLFSCFTDRKVVQTAWNLGLGGKFSTAIGAQHSVVYGLPVTMDVEVLLLTDGTFSNTGPMEHGVMSHCGRTVLLQSIQQPSIQIIVSEEVAPTHDPGLYQLHQIDFSSTRLLIVKAKNHFRAAFNSICSEIIDTDAPGPASLNIKLLPFKHLHHPIDH